jgi:HPt (histidine-containing phosphotransfer) domain-containing protein
MNEDDKKENLLAQIANIGERYLKRTLGDLEDIARLSASAQAGSPASLHELEHLAHQICGSAAMFGFSDVSAHARKIEQIAAKLGGKMPQGARKVSKIELRLQLRQSVEELTRVTRAAAERLGVDLHD